MSRRQTGTMIRTSASDFSRFASWCMLVPGPVLLGALGWWLAGPLLAAPLACLPVVGAIRRWNVTEQGFRVDDDGFDVIDKGASIRRVRWEEFAAIDVERRVKPRAFPGLMRLDDGELPLVPVVSLRDGEEWAVWPLAALPPVIDSTKANWGGSWVACGGPMSGGYSSTVPIVPRSLRP